MYTLMAKTSDSSSEKTSPLPRETNYVVKELIKYYEK